MPTRLQRPQSQLGLGPPQLSASQPPRAPAGNLATRIAVGLAESRGLVRQIATGKRPGSTRAQQREALGEKRRVAPKLPRKVPSLFRRRTTLRRSAGQGRREAEPTLGETPARLCNVRPP